MYFYFLKSKSLQLNDKALQNACNDPQSIIGLSKHAIKTKLGLHYNDINSNVWRYNLHRRRKLTSYNYLYIIFSNQKVTQSFLEVFKTQKYNKRYDFQWFSHLYS